MAAAPCAVVKRHRTPDMRIVAMIAFLGIALYVGGLIEHDFLMADVGASAFILGSMVVGAMSLWKRRKHR